MKSRDDDLDAVGLHWVHRVYEEKMIRFMKKKKESLANIVKIPNIPGLRYSVIIFIIFILCRTHAQKMFSDECLRMEMRVQFHIGWAMSFKIIKRRDFVQKCPNSCQIYPANVALRKKRIKIRRHMPLILRIKNISTDNTFLWSQSCFLLVPRHW